MNRSYLGLLALAGTTSTFFITGCASPVAERVVVSETATTACASTSIETVRNIRRLEPVGERIEIRRSVWRPQGARLDQRRYYNPMLQSFEQPWPYGPYDSSRN